MKVEVVTGTGPSVRRFTLADNEADVIIVDDSFVIDGAALEQIDEFLRGESIDVSDRGNDRVEISFQVLRAHLSIFDAEYFVLNHRSEIPREGKVVVTAQAGLGFGTEFEIPKAVVRRPRLLRYHGCASWWAYSLIGGSLE
jgi:hypothetical protein